LRPTTIALASSRSPWESHEPFSLTAPTLHPPPALAGAASWGSLSVPVSAATLVSGAESAVLPESVASSVPASFCEGASVCDVTSEAASAAALSVASVPPSDAVCVQSESDEQFGSQMPSEAQ
jgi:hypothetical protein